MTLPTPSTISSRDPDDYEIRQAIIDGRLVPPGEVQRLREALRECVDTMRAYGLPMTPAEDGAKALLEAGDV